MNKYINTLLLPLLLCALLPFSARSEPYAGLGISRVDTSTSSGNDTGDANGITIYGGNYFNQIGFEVGYSDIGDIDVPQSSVVITGNILKIQASFFTNFSEDFRLLAKLGIAIPDIENNLGWSYNDTELAWAVGMNYQFSKRLGFRVEYEQYDDLDGLDLNLLSFSLNTNF